MVTLEVSGSSVFIKHRVLPLSLRAPFKHTVDQLVDRGILKPVSHSWTTSIVKAHENGGRTLRICGDYLIPVNKFLKQTSYSISKLEDIFHQFLGSKSFSKLNLRDAFLQIPLDNKSP